MRSGQAAAVAAILGLGLLLSGCGGGVTAENEEEEVARTVFVYIHAVVGGNGRLACRTLTREQARAVVAGARARLPEIDARSCADAMSKVGRRLAPPVASALLAAPLINIHTVDGRASAELIGGSTEIRLMRHGAHWLISGGLNLWTARHRPNLSKPPSREVTALAGRV